MSAPTTRELAGKPVAEQLYEETARKWRDRTGTPIPGLASVAVGEDGPFRLYQRQQRRSFERQGLRFREVVVPGNASMAELRSTLAGLNTDPEVHGILLQHPLPRPLEFFAAMSEVSPEKDIDGVGIQNLGRLVTRQPIHVPAVAKAALEILRFYGLSPARKRVTVVGRSETVGIPTVLLLLMKGEWGDATVTVAHSGTSDLDAAVRGADIVISCAGKHRIVNRGNVKQGAVVVDVGVSGIPDLAKPGATRMVGDADAQELAGWASAVTPVPGGVGPVTVAELIRNTVVAWSLLEGAR